jgi:Bacteriophage clamp loader A subunit
MSLDLFKEIIPSILKTNEHLLSNEDEEKDYVPFLVNKSLSQHIDCIFYVNEMNLNCHLDKKMQYDYLYHSIRKYNRGYQKWFKNTESDNIQLIKEFYGYSTDKAKQVLPLLSKDNIAYIKNKLDKGGKS